MSKLKNTPMPNLPPAVLHLKSRNEVRVRELTIRDNMLCLITSGTKYLLQNGSSRLRYNTHSLLMLHQGSTVDIINEPPAGAPYQATIIDLSADYLESFTTRYQHDLSAIKPMSYNPDNSAITPVATDINVNAKAMLSETFKRTVTSIDMFNKADGAIDSLIYRHRLDELCLLLASLGYQFKVGRTMTTSDKIFRLVGSQLHKPWKKAEVAKSLNISESTLERRLKSEQTTFSQLLRTLRLEQAMSLLLQNQLSVGEVAYACGYQSHSRFSQAFYRHFAVLPSTIC